MKDISLTPARVYWKRCNNSA